LAPTPEKTFDSRLSGKQIFGANSTFREEIRLLFYRVLKHPSPVKKTIKISFTLADSPEKSALFFWHKACLVLR
ncbi:MAG: hypothetical protein Q7S98_01865, partial [Deltaproteobacteria bacterium]|nr:hypothetical protein [Deltaproteobacteria bacterium]